MKIPDIVYKRSDGTHSSSKLWLNLTNSVVLVVYAMIGWGQYKATTPNIEGLAILTLVVSGVVASNKLASDLIRARYNGSTTTTNTKSVEP